MAIKLNGVELTEKQMRGAEIVQERRVSPIEPRTVSRIILAVVIIAVLAGLGWFLVAPYERVVLKTEQCGLEQKKLNDGATYLVKEYVFSEWDTTSQSKEQRVVVNFKDENGRFGSEQYYPEDGDIVILDDEQTEAYVEVETSIRSKINPLTGEPLFVSGNEHETFTPTKLYVHESDILKLEDGTVEKRPLKQRDSATDNLPLVTKKGSRYVFGIEEAGWEFIRGDFSGTEGDDFEVVILENADEPAYVEGEICVGQCSRLGVPTATMEDDYRVYAIFVPTKLYIHESDIVEVAETATPTPEPEPGLEPTPTPEPIPEPTPTPEPESEPMFDRSHEEKGKSDKSVYDSYDEYLDHHPEKTSV